MSVALVQGASRGIGLEFVRQLSRRRNVQVIATCRNPDQAPELGQLGSNVKIEQLDVTKEDDMARVAAAVENQFGKIDLLLNSSGILHPSGRGETRLADVSSSGLIETFAVNTVGPLLMAKHFGKLLLAGNGGFGKHLESGSSHSSVMVNMSARVGSIGDNRFGGWYSYRLSKAALNMTTKNLSIELGRGKKRVICLSLHPGTVDTDLSRPYHKNVAKDKLFTPELSVSKLLTVIDNATIDQSGAYLDYQGEKIVF